MSAEDVSVIRAFLSQQPMATIATLDAQTAKPESALIAFAELDSLEIIFETYYDSRKYANLQHNRRVALVVGFDPKKHVTLQYEGKATELTGDDIEKYKKIFLQKDTPCTEEFLNNPKVRLFIARPTWMAYSDYTGKKPKIIELNYVN